MTTLTTPGQGHTTRRRRAWTPGVVVAVLLVTGLVAGGAVTRFATHEGGPLANPGQIYTGTDSFAGVVHVGDVRTYAVSLINHGTEPLRITGVSALELGAGLSEVGAVVSGAPVPVIAAGQVGFPPDAGSVFGPAVGAVIPPGSSVSGSQYQLALGLRVDRPGDWSLHGLRVTYVAGGTHYAVNLSPAGGVMFCVDQPSCSVAS